MDGRETADSLIQLGQRRRLGPDEKPDSGATFLTWCWIGLFVLASAYFDPRERTYAVGLALAAVVVLIADLFRIASALKEEKRLEQEDADRAKGMQAIRRGECGRCGSAGIEVDDRVWWRSDCVTAFKVSGTEAVYDDSAGTSDARCPSCGTRFSCDPTCPRCYGPLVCMSTGQGAWDSTIGEYWTSSDLVEANCRGCGYKYDPKSSRGEL